MTYTVPPVQAALTSSSALVAIAQDRISQTIAPEGECRPYVVWTIVSGVPENTLCCPPSEDDVRIQVDSYAASQPVALQMLQAAVTALENLGYIVFGPWNGFEDTTKLWRWSFDVEIWQTRA